MFKQTLETASSDNTHPLSYTVGPTAKGNRCSGEYRDLRAIAYDTNIMPIDVVSQRVVFVTWFGVCVYSIGQSETFSLDKMRPLMFGKGQYAPLCASYYRVHAIQLSSFLLSHHVHRNIIDISQP